MGMYFGDLHNHCGITYGYGGLKNALEAARKQLDFCTVTPHAMWPDIPEKTKENEYLVSYHTNAFDRIHKTWDEVKGVVESYNKDENFITFHSFEMHSSHYGDHHFVSPSDRLELIYGKNPQEIVSKQPCPTIAIPHHIGYCPGYRGINWEAFDARISPVVEVYSKHGCALNDTGYQGYYHTMGPKDSRNTAYSGLGLGKQFSFVASTDHHAGFPGSYGDGRLAVIAPNKTREAIWKAINEGKTYAITGDKIICDFSVNGYGFGSKIPQEQSKRTIAYRIEASDAIERVLICKNLKPLYVLDGLFIAETRNDNRYKIRLELGWGDEKDAYPWNCNVKCSHGEILGVESCVRGRSVLAPSKDKLPDEDINKLHFLVEQVDEQEVVFECETFKNPSPTQVQTSSIVLEVQGSVDTLLDFQINNKREQFTVGELLKGSRVGQMLSYASPSYRIHGAVPRSKYFAEGQIDDVATTDKDFYHMEVLERNGNAAFVSPIYFG